MNGSNRGQAGFTLVELAIVLVIIGLLLGGVLKGQQLVTSARVRALADQNAAVQAAYHGFYDRYRRVPGDMTAAEADQAMPGATVTVGGNGNGRLDAAGGSEWTEPNAVWAHLAAAGFITGSYTGSSTEPSLDAHAPRNAYAGFLVLGRSADYLEGAGAPAERLQLVAGRGVPAEVLRELDVKLDDGLPGSGAVRAVASGAAAKFGEAARAGSTACVGGGSGQPVWNVDGAQGDCNATHLW